MKIIKVDTHHFVDIEGNAYTNLLGGSKIGTLLPNGGMRKLRGSITKDGYILINFGAKKNRKYLHHLVLEAFVGSRPEGHYGCHKNDIKTDNRLENLYWGTPTENNHDAARNGKLFDIGKFSIGNSVNKTSDIVIGKLIKFRKEGLSIKDVAEKVGISYPTAWKYCKENNLNKAMNMPVWRLIK